MGKILFVLEVPEPAPRKPLAPPSKKHKDKKLYSRKVKHKKSPVNPAGDFLISFSLYNGLFFSTCYSKFSCQNRPG